MKRLIILLLGLLFIACSNDFSTEDVVNEAFMKKDNANKCEWVEPTQEDYAYIVNSLNDNSYVYSRYLQYKGFHGFVVANFPCDANPYGYSDGNGMNFFDDVVWRWELYDESNIVVADGCFKTICYATNVKLPKNVKEGNYHLKFIDFPEVTKQFNVIIQ